MGINGVIPPDSVITKEAAAHHKEISGMSKEQQFDYLALRGWRFSPNKEKWLLSKNIPAAIRVVLTAGPLVSLNTALLVQCCLDAQKGNVNEEQ